MDVEVRSARGDEYGLLLRIWRRAVEETHHFLRPEDIDWYENLVAHYLPAMNDLRVACDASRRPIGFIAQDDGEIHMLFVDPDSHGHGVGTRLLDDVARRFDVLLVDVNEDNPSGRRFYEARGFTQVGRSELDAQGRPFPILHLRRSRS